MYHLVEVLRKVAIMIKPVMEDSSKSIFDQLGITNTDLMDWDSISKYPQYDNIKVAEKGTPLFVRLDVNEEIEFLKNEMNK